MANERTEPEARAQHPSREPTIEDAAIEQREETGATTDHTLDAPAVPFIGRRSHQRLGVESLFVRVIATLGIVGVAVAIAAILGTQGIHAWIIGLVISLVSVILAAVLWSSRTL
jgi:hypothetical protein